MIELLLLGILIMQLISFHSTASSSGRYMRAYDALTHRLTKYMKDKTVNLCKKTSTKIRGKLNGK